MPVIGVSMPYDRVTLTGVPKGVQVCTLLGVGKHALFVLYSIARMGNA